MSRRYKKRKRQQDTALEYVLKALIPYSQPNLKLVFSPYRFFAELEQITYKKKQTLKNVYYKAQKQGFIEIDGHSTPRLTEKGKKQIKPYQPKYLGSSAKLIVMFDIPENDRWKRHQLRLLLKELSFRQVQKSVWESRHDHRAYLKAEIKRFRLDDHVLVYEARLLA